ncbi:MAG: tetratricopeptide repeat protein [Eubacterium sp.]|nr:tetratricopeptide repeat protein [Eubacterium sp.]
MQNWKRVKFILPAMLLSAACILPGCGDTSDTAYTKGMSALASEDYNTAITNFQTAIDTDGQDAEGYRGLGIAYLYLGNYAEAVDAFSKSLDAIRYPGQNQDFREDVLLYQAQAYTEEEQYDNAMTIYNELLDSSKHAGEAYLLRGRLYALENKFGQAGQDFQKAVELDDSYDVYLEIYNIYTEGNRQADGTAFLKEVLNQKPSSGDDYYQMGKVCYVLKDYENAESYLKTAIEKKTSGAEALLGRVYLDAGDYDNAGTFFQECIDNDTEVSLGYNGLALIDILQGQYDDALQSIQSGLDSNDKTYEEELLYNEIIAYEKKLDFETAAEKMKSFLQSYPSNTKAVQENLFLQSRVQEMQSTASENVISSSGTGSMAENISSSSASDSTAADSQSDVTSNNASSFVDEDQDGYDDNTGVYYGTDTGTDNSGTYYDGSTDQTYGDAYQNSGW